MSFERALPLLLRYEGGFVDNPDDRGGATFAGVSHKAVVGLRDDGGRLVFDLDNDGDVDTADIRALKDFPDKVAWFYEKNYWTKAGCGELFWPFSFLVFDAAVHSGVRQGVVLLQKAVDVSPDGVVGPATRQALDRAILRCGVLRTAQLALWERAVLFAGICQRRPSQRQFLSGWLTRLVEVEKEARK